jgi:hypothetical protein
MTPVVECRLRGLQSPPPLAASKASECLAPPKQPSDESPLVRIALDRKVDKCFGEFPFELNSFGHLRAHFQV